jgi:MSHA biogenesis protein MshQ
MRSGRLRLSNAFGSERAALQMPVQAQYWSGNSWVINNADNCTALAANAFALSGGIAANTSAAAVALAGGNGTLTLAAPTGAVTGSVDVAANLGTAGNDQSCLGAHGGTAANLPWLRSQNGNCAATFDRDPSARATFGIYSPETRRSIHVRELF